MAVAVPLHAGVIQRGNEVFVLRQDGHEPVLPAVYRKESLLTHEYSGLSAVGHGGVFLLRREELLVECAELLPQLEDRRHQRVRPRVGFGYRQFSRP